MEPNLERTSCICKAGYKRLDENDPDFSACVQCEEDLVASSDRGAC